jgi:hypothetical protein
VFVPHVSITGDVPAQEPRAAVSRFRPNAARRGEGDQSVGGKHGMKPVPIGVGPSRATGAVRL